MDGSEMKGRALKKALAEAMALVDEAEVMGMKGRRAPKIEIEVESGEGPEDCPDCKAGECVKHLSPEDAEGMASMFEGEG